VLAVTAKFDVMNELDHYHRLSLCLPSVCDSVTLHPRF